MAKRILLTGGAGLIGSHITDHLLEDTSDIESITIFDNFSRGTYQNIANALKSPLVNVVEGDILDLDAVDKVVGNADYIFHLPAIRITRCALEPRLANDILVNGTFNVLEAAIKHDIKKVVASSSASVYGLAEEFPTNEAHHPYANDTIYGAAKAYNEGMLRSFKAANDLDYIALRYFNVFGPRMDTEGKYTEVFIRWMQAIVNGESPLIHGDGSATMDFIYVKDIARANVLAMNSEVTDEVFNVASGVETSLRQLAETLLNVMGSDVGLKFTEARAVNGVSRRLADTSKAKKLLGFEASTSLEQGLKEMVAWWQLLDSEQSKTYAETGLS